MVLAAYRLQTFSSFEIMVVMPRLLPAVVVTKWALRAEHDKNNHIGETPCLTIIIYYVISSSVHSFATHSMIDRF